MIEVNKMSDKKKIEKIKTIVKKAERDFKPVKMVLLKKGVGVLQETKKLSHKRLEHNFYVYARAVEKVMDLVIDKNEMKSVWEPKND